MLRRVAVLTVVAALALVSSGCGAVGDGADRRVRLPAALPTDVPFPVGAVLRSARDLGSKGLNLVFETDEPVSAVAGQLRSRLEAGGWILLSEVVVDGAAFSSYRKQLRSVSLGISRTGGLTVVGLAYWQSESQREGVQG